MKNFNISTFLIATGFCGILLIPSFICAFAEDEGTMGNNVIWIFFAKLFYVLRFPTHTLLWAIFQEGKVYVAGLIINCFFYGLVFERLFYLLKRKNADFAK